jgi:hypothetical protein
MRPTIYRRAREVFAAEWGLEGSAGEGADAYVEAVMAESAARGVPVEITLFERRCGTPTGQALPIWGESSFREAVLQRLMA